MKITFASHQFPHMIVDTFFFLPNDFRLIPMMPYIYFLLELTCSWWLWNDVCMHFEIVFNESTSHMNYIKLSIFSISTKKKKQKYDVKMIDLFFGHFWGDNRCSTIDQ